MAELENETRETRRPDATLLTAPGCSHCPAVMDGLVHILKEGGISRLEIVDITRHPETAQSLGVRSVPWIRIGPFEFTGALSKKALAEWAEAAASGSGSIDYYRHLIESRELDKLIQRIRDYPAGLLDLLLLFEDPDTSMTARIGIGALFEELAGDPLLREIVPELERLTRSQEPRIRADACHYLSLTEDPQALEMIRPLLEDSDPEVREIALESLAVLQALTHPPGAPA